MASPAMAAARMKNNTVMAKTAGRVATTLATGVVNKGLPKVAQRVLGSALGPMGGVLTDVTEAGAEDHKDKINKWVPKNKEIDFRLDK